MLSIDIMKNIYSQYDLYDDDVLIQKHCFIQFKNDALTSMFYFVVKNHLNNETYVFK